MAGAVGRFFRGGVRPVEISHRIAREMSDSRSVGVAGQAVVANHFEIGLAPDDLARFEEISDALIRELGTAARQTARDEGWKFMGPVRVVLGVDARLRGGSLIVRARMKQAEAGAGVLHLANGQQFVLGEYLVTLGRHPDCTITFDDPNVSREHGEIRPDGDGFVITDLRSTNGTTVNGATVAQHRLEDGDQLSLGATTKFEFRAG